MRVFRGVPIYGTRNAKRADVRTDQKSMDRLTGDLVRYSLELQPLDASAANYEVAVRQAKFAAAEHLINKRLFPAADVRDFLHNFAGPYQPQPGSAISRLPADNFNIDEWLEDLRAYSALLNGKQVFDVGILIESKNPDSIVDFILYHSQPDREATQTLYYLLKHHLQPPGGTEVRLLHALVPMKKAVLAPAPAAAPAPAPASVPAPVPLVRADRRLQPDDKHHYSAAPYASWHVEKILDQVHTEHMFGGVILVLYLKYSKAELFKKLNAKREGSEGLTRFGTNSKQVVHYRIKKAMEHIYGLANFDDIDREFKAARQNPTQAAELRAELDDARLYNIDACEICSKKKAPAAARNTVNVTNVATTFINASTVNNAPTFNDSTIAVPSVDETPRLTNDESEVRAKNDMAAQSRASSLTKRTRQDFEEDKDLPTDHERPTKRTLNASVMSFAAGASSSPIFSSPRRSAFHFNEHVGSHDSQQYPDPGFHGYPTVQEHYPPPAATPAWYPDAPLESTFLHFEQAMAEPIQTQQGLEGSDSIMWSGATQQDFDIGSQPFLGSGTDKFNMKTQWQGDGSNPIMWSGATQQDFDIDSQPLLGAGVDMTEQWQVDGGNAGKPGLDGPQGSLQDGMTTKKGMDETVYASSEERLYAPSDCLVCDTPNWGHRSDCLMVYKF